MAAFKVLRRDSKQFPAAPTRTASYMRVKSPSQPDEGALPPSTLPPPPFGHEGDVPALEWWLDAHMGLASEVTWIEQLRETGHGEAHADTVRHLVSQVEAVRDALYELYCDAADKRLAPLVPAGAALELHVRATYRWCSRVVTLLATILNGLRSEAGADWTAIKVGFRDAAGRYVGPSDALREAAQGLALDTGNPTEPLRNFPQDLEELFKATEALQATLATRFA
jgi:hypothetical protein